MTKTFLFLALGLLAGQASGQVAAPTGPVAGGPTPPGGSGGGPTPPGGPPPATGSWVIQYKGQVYDQDGRLVWSRDQYAADANDDTREVVRQSDANGVRGIGSGGSLAFVHGTVSVRRHWTGTGTPTPGQNFRIHSNAGALAVFISTASANNGFESKSGPSVTVDSLKLIQPSGGSDGDTVVAFSTTGEKASFFVGAAFDYRSASIKANTLPDAYYVKGADASATSSLNDELWSRTIVRSKPYTYQTPKAQNPVRMDGANWLDIRTIGLPEGFFDFNTNQSRGSGILASTFTGKASTEHVAPESYTFTDDLSGTTVSESLPSFGGGWDVEPIGPVLAHGGEQTLSGTTLRRTERSSYAESVKLKYRWSDGLQADAELALVFTDRFSNDRLIQPETIHSGGGKPFVFPDGLGSLGTVEYQPWEGGLARRVRWTDEQVAYKAFSTVVNVAAGALSLVQPEAAAVTALIGVGLSIGSPTAGEGDLTPDNPFTTDTDLLKHELTINNAALAQSLAGASNDEKMRILSPRMQWKALYIAEAAVDVYVRDEYGTVGYVGPTLRQKRRPVPSPIASQAKKFIYQAS